MPSGARRRTTSVAANSTSANVLSGEVIEFPGVASSVIVAATVLAASANVVLLNLQLGSDRPVDGMAIAGEALAGRGPIIPDDVMVKEVAGGADRISLTFTNTSGGAVVVTWYVEVQPL
jgi:hypothetical protein